MKRQVDNLFSRTDTVTDDDLALVVVLKGNQSSSIPVTPGAGGTATAVVTRVPANVASTQLLAAAAGRHGATFQNNATTNLFLKLGTTANITAGAESYTVKMVPNSYYEVPFGYTGRIDGIWDGADATGEVVITELTA